MGVGLVPGFVLESYKSDKYLRYFDVFLIMKAIYFLMSLERLLRDSMDADCSMRSF